jgi:hypothetical protein
MLLHGIVVAGNLSEWSCLRGSLYVISGLLAGESCFRIVLYSHLGVAMSVIRFFLCLAAIPILAMTQ